MKKQEVAILHQSKCFSGYSAAFSSAILALFLQKLAAKHLAKKQENAVLYHMDSSF